MVKFLPRILLLFPPFDAIWKNSASLNACFPLFHTPFFISNLIEFQLTPKLKEQPASNLALSILIFVESVSMKKIAYFLKQLNFGLFKNIFRLKTICKSIFPKCFVY